MSMMAPLVTALDEALQQLDALGAPDHKNPHAYHERKSDLRAKLAQTRNIASGNYRIAPPPAPKPEPIKPGKITVEGRVIDVTKRAPHWFRQDKPGVKKRTAKA